MASTTDHLAARPEVPPEWWQTARARAAAWWASRPRLARRWARVRAVGLWVSIVLVLVMLALVESTRDSVRVYVGSFVLLVVWFVLARTKTVSWATTARLFSVAVLWSAFLGWFTLQVAAALDLWPSSDGSGVALAGFLEETGKLVPLLALALLAPGRVRRFSATDWSLVGFASGIAFNAYEDAVRQVASRGTLWLFWNPPEPYTLNPWTTAGFASVDGVAVAHGHHIWTVTTAMSIGLGIALWRTGRVPARVGAVALPVLSFVLTVAEHASYNAHNSHSTWPAETAAGFPAVLSGLWSLTGHGRATGAASVVLLVACLLVDVQRRHHAALLTPAGGEGQRPAGAVGDTEPGARVLGWWQARVDRWEGATRRLAGLVTPLLRAATQWWGDVAVVLAAHARVDGEPRRLAVGRARAVAVHVRNIRAEAMALTTPGVEPQARAVFRRTAAVVGLVGVALALWWGTTMATAIGRSLLLDGDGNYLAGLLENAGQWWNGLSPGQQIAVGAGVAALVALSGGSLALAIGVSGVATYGLSHAEGAATFTRDPVRATADYLATTTPLEAGLDAGELVLTFLPGNFAGAAAGRGARSLLSAGGRTSVRADPPSGPLAAIDEWIGDVNPGYTGDPFDPRSVNCGKCTESVHDVFQGQALTPAGLGTYTVPEMEAITGLRQVEMSPEQIADELRSGGAGSHAVVGIDRADDSGHWFNAYFDGERVVAVDGQSGEILDWPPDFGAIRWDAAIRRMNP